MNNAILVLEEDGLVKHRFCAESEATEHIESCRGKPQGASMFLADHHDVEFVFSVSPNLRQKVEEAKEKLKNDIRLRNALDKYDVPKDFELRQSISKAFADLARLN